MNRRGRPAGPISLAMEIQANGRELARALAWGGEPNEHKARAIAGAILRDATALQRQLEGPQAA